MYLTEGVQQEATKKIPSISFTGEDYVHTNQKFSLF